MMKPNSRSESTDHMFTKLSACEALERTFTIFSENLCTYLSFSFLLFGLAFVAGFVGAIFIVAADGATTTTTTTNTSFNTTTTTEQMSVGTILLVTCLVCLLLPVIMILVAAMIRTTAEIYAGEKPQLGAALQVGVRSVCRLLCFGLIMLVPVGAMLLVGVIMIGVVHSQQNLDGSNTTGIILGVVFLPLWLAGWTYIMIPFQMAQPSIVLENRTVIAVVSRAWELASGGRLTIFVATFGLALMSFLLGLIPFVNFLWHLCAMPLSSILATVLFLNLRVDKEGLNRSGLRGELGLDILEDETEMVESEVFQYESPKIFKDVDGAHDEVV